MKAQDAPPFRGICLNSPKPEDLPWHHRMIEEVLPKHRCNTVVLLIRYQYRFQSHPEVADGSALTLAQVRELVKACRANGLRLIPKMNLLGHQSEKGRGSEQALLRAHPEFDETPELEQLSYARSLCPRHPKVGALIRDLIDELLEAFEADALHVGLDEVFEIGRCPRCRDEKNHVLFGEWTNQLHDRISGRRKAEMFMWGDRLLDRHAMPYDDYETSANDTWQAIENLPRDIVICDWHYNLHPSYPSIDWFIKRGHRVIACPWVDQKSAQAFLQHARQAELEKTGKGALLGVMQTSWCDSAMLARHLLNADVPTPTKTFTQEIPRYVAANFPMVMDSMRWL